MLWWQLETWNKTLVFAHITCPARINGDVGKSGRELCSPSAHWYPGWWRLHQLEHPWLQQQGQENARGRLQAMKCSGWEMTHNTSAHNSGQYWSHGATKLQKWVRKCKLFTLSKRWKELDLGKLSIRDISPREASHFQKIEVRDREVKPLSQIYTEVNTGNPPL